MGNRITSVLFACTQNAVRSPMALGLLRMLHGNAIFVDSVGLRAGETDGFMITVMAELGIDISKHQPKTFEDLQDHNFDLVISLSPEAHHTALEMTRHTSCEAEYWPILDPTWVEGNRNERLDAYRSVRDTLLERIRQRLPPGTANGGK
ncbi:MAG TPA: low molecular weight phosphatase family protein [Stellaceae bacterium]|nr:low molecular weight phosphatase family protein [Stellaceae bacterium]